ncbi:hypothetical protein PybrP1_001710 [[Pythium] brassicae (nom. inval.)]|nr:hypothetical protein PybrP1_001710 [[Pythium] brassicae (nom. inval.)]
MRLAYDAFCAEGERLVDLSQRAAQHSPVAEWRWRHGNRAHLPGNAFLVSTANDDEAVLPATPATTAEDCGRSTETVVCEFHVVFHVVYQTPVLYFRAARLDGSLFPIAYHISMLQLPGSRIGAVVVASMEEHPVLGTPFWFLHPCETAAAMELLVKLQHATVDRTPNSKDIDAVPAYLLSWLSLVAPLTGISPLDYVGVSGGSERELAATA